MLKIVWFFVLLLYAIIIPVSIIFMRTFFGRQDFSREVFYIHNNCTSGCKTKNPVEPTTRVFVLVFITLSLWRFRRLPTLTTGTRWHHNKNAYDNTNYSMLSPWLQHVPSSVPPGTKLHAIRVFSTLPLSGNKKGLEKPSPHSYNWVRNKSGCCLRSPLLLIP